MGLTNAEKVLGRRSVSTRDPVVATVTRVDAAGLWVTPLGQDSRHPTGPCRGPLGLEAGVVVLLVWTQEKPWVVYPAAGGGEPGAPGQSAYALAVALGFVGSEAAWIASLHGDPGDDGDDGVDGGHWLTFQGNGTLTAKTYPTALYVPRTANYRLHATVNTRGSGASLIVNAYVAGVALLAGGNRPTIAAGAGTGHDAADVVSALTIGDIVTAVEVVQVGAGWTTVGVQLIEEP